MKCHKKKNSESLLRHFSRTCTSPRMLTYWSLMKYIRSITTNARWLIVKLNLRNEYFFSFKKISLKNSFPQYRPNCLKASVCWILKNNNQILPIPPQVWGELWHCEYNCLLLYRTPPNARLQYIKRRSLADAKIRSRDEEPRVWLTGARRSPRQVISTLLFSAVLFNNNNGNK